MSWPVAIYGHHSADIVRDPLGCTQMAGDNLLSRGDNVNVAGMVPLMIGVWWEKCWLIGEAARLICGQLCAIGTGTGQQWHPVRPLKYSSNSDNE